MSISAECLRFLLQKTAPEGQSMDHNYAMQNHAAERYLLRELSEIEREAYDENFFSQPCAEAEDIKSSMEFLRYAIAVVENEVIRRNHALKQPKDEGVAKAKKVSPQYLSDPTMMSKRKRSGRGERPVPRRQHGASPPADAEYILEFFPENEEKLLQLKIKHSKMSDQYGHFKANVWYWFQTIRSIGPHVWPFIKKIAAVTAILGLVGK